jgi:hypothetical protein
MSENTVDSKNVVVTDIKMPFGSMVIFLIKLALASIPALLVIYAVLFACIAILALVFGGTAGLIEMFRQFSNH